MPEARRMLFPVSWDELHRNTRQLAWRLLERGPFTGIVAITRGGLIPAGIIARELDIRLIETFCIASYDHARPDAAAGEAVLTLSDQGAVHGEIHAPRVTINGEVRGDIHAGERLELAGAARIEGNVYYKVLEMAAGAQVNGRMVHQAEVPKQLPRPKSDEAAEPAGASASKA